MDLIAGQGIRPSLAIRRLPPPALIPSRTENSCSDILPQKARDGQENAQIHRQLQRSRGWWNLAEPAAAVAFPEERRKQGGPKEPGNSAAFGCLSGPAPLKRIQCCPAGVRPRRVFSKRGEGTLLSERTTLTRIAVIGDTILCEGRRRLAKKVHAPTSFRIETNTRSYSFLCDAA